MSQSFKSTLIVGFALLLVIASAGFYYLKGDEKPAEVCQTNSALATKTLTANNVQLTTEVAASGTEQATGLSGRNCIADDHAMLFPYAVAGDYCFWMKDMNFSIDMIWLDDEKKVVTIAANVSPETYPKQSFCPERPAQYIVEVQAGKAKASGWGIDTQFVF